MAINETPGPSELPQHPGNGASVPEPMSAHEVNYRRSMGALIGAMNASSRVSRLDVRADRLEVIVQNQVVTMQALMMAMDLMLQMCGRAPEIRFEAREKPADLVVPS